MRDEKRQLFEMQNISCYVRCTQRTEMFSQKLQIEHKLTKTQIIQISKKVISLYDGFAFPYLDDNIDKEDTLVTFALLHKDDASALIKKGQIPKAKYNVILDQVAKCKIKIKVPEMSKCGIALEEVAENDLFQSSTKTNAISEKDYHCMWKGKTYKLVFGK